MDCRKFKITLLSANDLEDVRKLFKMKVYARVSIGSNPETEKRTPPDKHGEVNPAWNFTLNYTINETMLHDYNNTLVIKLYCKRKLGDRYVGEVHASMKDLFDYSKQIGGSAVVTHPVLKGSVPSQGVLRFSYKFGEKVSIDKQLLIDNIDDWSLFKG
ncbi:OLC1v1012561C1 [Oldenlandia corymbosa var. corymbosa]|uniref:OLC1v1012561C1 n=1 Tax=Oldenlandia corymbosa var. corymbosa TaxID=529605 RepID=A0AAV1DZS1_OLDCO|nr:OLC1v1012561C1 [Oldenlandia corymbosa var. corymbosa]